MSREGKPEACQRCPYIQRLGALGEWLGNCLATDQDQSECAMLGKSAPQISQEAARALLAYYLSNEAYRQAKMRLADAEFVGEEMTRRIEVSKFSAEREEAKEAYLKAGGQ